MSLTPAAHHLSQQERGVYPVMGERGEVEAREPGTERIVRVAGDPGGEPAWEPKQVVALAAFGEGSCLTHAAGAR